MKRTVLAWTMSMALAAAPAWAQHGHGGGKPTATPHASAPKVTTPHGSQSPKAGHGSTHASGPKSTTHGPKTTTAHGKSGNAHSSATNTSVNTTALTPVQQKLQQNTNLASKLQSRLPAGTDLNAAAAGFRNLGQFVAAVNVSNNLGIPFAELKTRMVDRNMSLGQAIHDARPSTTDTTVIVTHAEQEADQMIGTTAKTTKKTKTTKDHK